MRKKLTAFLAVLGCTALAACSAQTNDASNITASSAQLNSAINFDQGDGPGELWFEGRPVGGSTFIEISGTRQPYGDLAASGSTTFSRTWSNLSPGTYEYRLCGYGDKDFPDAEVCVDDDGYIHSRANQGDANTVYDSFSTSTGVSCNKVVGAGTSFSSAMSGVSAGQTVCLNSGTYNWGDYTPPSGITITAQNGVVANVFGEARITNPNVSIKNLYLKAQDGENHAVLSVEDNNFVSQYNDVDTRHVGHVQGYLVGGGSSGVKILDNVIHGARGPAGSTCSSSTTDLNQSQFHAIYWYGSTGGEVSRVWMYDNSGYGLHFYSGTGANTTVNQTVTDDSMCSRGNVFDSQTGPVVFNQTVITDAGPWSCKSPGATVNNSRSQSGFSGCSGSGNVTADTAYDDEANRNYGNDVSGHFNPGPH